MVDIPQRQTEIDTEKARQRHIQQKCPGVGARRAQEATTPKLRIYLVIPIYSVVYYNSHNTVYITKF